MHTHEDFYGQRMGYKFDCCPLTNIGPQCSQPTDPRYTTYPGIINLHYAWHRIGQPPPPQESFSFRKKAPLAYLNWALSIPAISWVLCLTDCSVTSFLSIYNHLLVSANQPYKERIKKIEIALQLLSFDINYGPSSAVFVWS